MRGLNLSTVARKPLKAPINAPKHKAKVTDNHILSIHPKKIVIKTPVKPATAATDKSNPPAIMSGVPAAAIKPIYDIFIPIFMALLKEKNQGDIKERPITITI